MIVYSDLRWPDKTGIGVFQREIMQRAPRWVDVVDLNVKGRTGSPLSPIAISNALARNRATSGIFFSPGYMPPAWSKVPSIVTVHDLLHLHFHTRFHIAYYALILKRLYRKCRNIICVSAHGRREFLRWSGLPPDRVLAVHNGVSDIFRTDVPGTVFNFPYVFFPGSHKVHKNKIRLIQAYAASALPRCNVHLVFTGEETTFLLREAERCGVSGLLHFAGNVSDDKIVRLYKGALFVAYVSLHEGFGLPIVEAMAAGVPVLTSNTTAMPEVAGDAALLVNPYSIDDMVQGLNILAFNEGERALRIRLGRERAKRYTWDAAAKTIWAVLGSR
jgi:glycosyltransferase involved in cell wall biosynthesis